MKRDKTKWLGYSKRINVGKDAKNTRVDDSE